MSVAEVRRGLDAVRTRWNQRPARFYFTEKIFNGMTVQQFCTEFTLGHHNKRHAKSKTGGGKAPAPAPAPAPATSTEPEEKTKIQRGAESRRRRAPKRKASSSPPPMVTRARASRQKE